MRENQLLQTYTSIFIRILCFKSRRNIFHLSFSRFGNCRGVPIPPPPHVLCSFCETSWVIWIWIEWQNMFRSKRMSPIAFFPHVQDSNKIVWFFSRWMCARRPTNTVALFIREENIRFLCFLRIHRCSLNLLKPHICFIADRDFWLYFEYLWFLILPEKSMNSFSKISMLSRMQYSNNIYLR